MAKVTLIGSGKTATALGNALMLAGHEIVQVWNRSKANAEELAEKLNATATADLSTISDLSLIHI